MSRYDRLEEVEKGIDTIEEVKKFNPYHGKDGRFASKGGGGGAIAVGPGPEGAAAAGLEGFGRSRIIRAMTMAEGVGAKELSGTISRKKVKDAIDRGGSMNEACGKHYLISPQSDHTITVYTGTKNKNGGLDTEKYQTGFRDLKDCKDWATGTILNERMTVKEFKATWEIKGGVSKSIDHIEEVKKFNEMHDELGRFASKNGGGGAGGGATKEALGELNSLPKHAGTRKVPYEEIKEYEKVLAKFPVGTKLSQETSAGTEIYEKISDSEIGIAWKQTAAPFNTESQRTAFDVARWIAGTGFISRGDIKEIEP